MIKLFIDKNQIGAGGTATLRWCVSRDVLEGTGDKEAYLLIIVVPKGGGRASQLTQVVQLNAGVTYINFGRAGENRVFAKVYFGTKKAGEDFLRNAVQISDDSTNWLDRAANYEEKIARCNREHNELTEMTTIVGTPESDARAAKLSQVQSDLSWCTEQLKVLKAAEKFRGVSDPIIVPADCFAKEWPAWLNTWVNWMEWSGRPLDECNRRRRALFGFTIQPLLMVLILLFRLLNALFHFMIGSSGVNYTASVRLFKYRTWDIWNKKPGVFWFPNPDRDDSLASGWGRLALAPFCPILIVLAMVIVHAKWGFGFHALHWWTLAAIASIFACELFIAACCGICALMFNIGKVINPFKWLAYFFSGGSAKLSRDDVVRLACTGDCVPDPSDDRKTVRLWYMHIKAKVCKPMQG